MTKKATPATAKKAGWYPGRCKDCGELAAPGKARCAEHATAHNAREATRRADRKAAGKCTVAGCSKRARRVDGVTLATCAEHGEYFRARAAEARG